MNNPIFNLAEGFDLRASNWHNKALIQLSKKRKLSKPLLGNVNIACQPRLDVMKEGFSDLSAGGPVIPPDQFGLEGFEEGFNGSIIVAVAFAAHRYLEARFRS